jgi:3',5'-cyclic AMP phosphodiesterase CpdA
MPIHVLPPTLTRRRLLAAGLGAAASLSFTGGCADRPGWEGGWYAWCSDIHVAADESARLNGQTMLENLRAFVDDVGSARQSPRGLLINGDMSLLDGQRGDYETMMRVLRPIVDDGVPLHFTLGNHDHREHFQQALAPATPEEQELGKHVGIVEDDDLRMVILDSLERTNVTGGAIGPAQLDWLARSLDNAPDVPTIVFVHHHLNASKRSALHDTKALMNVLRPRAQAKAVVYGHTHVWNVQRIDGIYAINLPAVGYKFHRREPLGWCAFRPLPGGGELQLRCVGGEMRHNGELVRLRWRTA